jgi:hypothetical protein
MTANEMLDAIKVGYDAMYSLSAPGFENPSYSILLTKAQFIFVRKTLSPKNNRNQEGFEETEVRNQGLAALIKDGLDNIPSEQPAVSSTQTGALPTEVFWDLPSDFMYAIMEGATTNIPDCSTTQTTYRRIPVKPISHNEYYQNFYNPYRKPWTDGYDGLVWRITYSPTGGVKRHGLVTDGSFQVTNYHLRYLKFPTAITVNPENPTNQVNCELAASTHEAIVQIAIKLLAIAVREQMPVEELSIDNIE